MKSSVAFKTQNFTASTTSQSTQLVSSSKENNDTKTVMSMVNHATPSSMVSAFCRSALSNLIPKGFWGTGDAQKSNEKVFLKNVDRFIELRRFENLSLHEVSQGVQVSSQVTYVMLYPNEVLLDLGHRMATATEMRRR
jgi:hypothetical protein